MLFLLSDSFIVVKVIKLCLFSFLISSVFLLEQFTLFLFKTCLLQHLVKKLNKFSISTSNFVIFSIKETIKVIEENPKLYPHCLIVNPPFATEKKTEPN